MSVHPKLRVRFYPAHGEWTCVVQQLGADGMPMDPDLVSASGPTKEDALRAAIQMAPDEDVESALREYVS
jgi:hypothetical protein